MGRKKIFVDPRQGERLHEALKDNRLSQTDIAYYLGVDASGISKYKRNENKLPPEKAAKIAVICNVRAEWLLCLDDLKRIEPPTDEEIAAALELDWEITYCAERLLRANGIDFSATLKHRPRITMEKIQAEDGNFTLPDGEKAILAERHKFDDDAPDAYYVIRDGKKYCEVSANRKNELIAALADAMQEAAKRHISSFIESLE